jgi:hypothetical protein
VSGPLPSRIEPRLRALVLLFLWGALIEDALLVVMAWLAPDLWFRLFHASTPAGLEVAFLRRSAGQWAAFAIAQAVALWRWRRDPLWLVIAAGVRFSDLLTDISYVLAVPSLTRLGWILLLPPPVLNLAGVVILLRGYGQVAVTRTGAPRPGRAATP